MIADVATLALGVGGASLAFTVVVNPNFVCRVTFSSASFAGVTLVYLLFSPRRGMIACRRFPTVCDVSSFSPWSVDPVAAVRWET